MAEEKTEAEKQEEELDSKVEYETECFAFDFLPWGSLDIRAALKALIQVGEGRGELIELIEDAKKEYALDYDKLDINDLVYNHILQEARSKIYETLKFDIQNDADFYVSANACCTSYDYNTESMRALTNAISEATDKQIDELLEDDYVKFFFENIDFQYVLSQPENKEIKLPESFKEFLKF